MVSKNLRYKIAFISTFPPRECGIATFTRDLTKAIQTVYSPNFTTAVLAMNASPHDTLPYPKEVAFEIDETDKSSFAAAADFVNHDPSLILVNVQHEFGIFGGLDKDLVLHFYRRVKKPVVTTFHTVLPAPNPFTKSQVEEIVKLSSKIIVLTAQSRETLISHYSVDTDKISVIAHGIHPIFFVKPEIAKKKFGLSGRDVISTFGLLSPDKGIEYVLHSLPALVRDFPRLLYLIIGETHPKLVEREGEKYRRQLKSLVRELKLENHVKFYNKYLTNSEILRLLQASDVYVSGNLNPDQAVSGTLSYAVGTGRAVVSTSYSHARDLITPEMGILVGFKKPEEFSSALKTLLSDKDRLSDMHLHAYFKTRYMLWNNIAIAYVREFSALAKEIRQEDKKLPPVNLKHLNKLMDSFAVRQFSHLHQPQNQSGYTVDDNARAMIALTWLYQLQPDVSYLKQISQILKFLHNAKTDQGLLNYFHKNGRPTDQNFRENLEDANGRAVWSLGVVVSSNLPDTLKKSAYDLLTHILNYPNFTNHLRAKAFSIKGITLLPPKLATPYLPLVTSYADELVSYYETNSQPSWQWFEPTITYANTILCDALLMAHRLTQNKRYLQVSQTTLDFYISCTHNNGLFMPVGERGWFPKGGDKAVFDQQPEAASDLCLTSAAMYFHTGDQKYREVALKTFYFFLGDNILGEELYDRTTGACFDGLTKDGINLNQGAESTMSYLLSRLVVAHPHLLTPAGKSFKFLPKLKNLFTSP